MAKDNTTVDVKSLSGTELGTEQARIAARLKVIADILMRSDSFAGGVSLENRIGALTVTHKAGSGLGELNLNPFAEGGYNHPELRKTTIQGSDSKGQAASIQLGDLADEYKNLEKRANQITDRLNAEPSLKTDAGQAAANASKPTFGSGDNQGNPLSGWAPVFINDAQIQDLARTGEFDITPTAIANMFPDIAKQRLGAEQTAAAQAGESYAPSIGEAQQTAVSNIAPEQYNAPGFVDVGKDFPYLPDPTQEAINRIKAQGLPAWEEERMIQLVLQNKTTGYMTEDEYNAQKQKILDQGLPHALEGQRLQELAQQYNQQKKPDVLSQAQDYVGSGRSSLRDIVGRPYSWNADQVAATAVELFKAGYLQIPNYDPTKALSQQMHITSAFDPDFQKAYLQWVDDSFKDRSKSMMDILHNRQESFLPQLKQMADAIAAKNKPPPLVVKLTDAAGIRQQAEALAKNVAGFTLGDDEYSQLISYIHGLETQSQTAAYNATYQGPDYHGPGGTVQDVDVSGELEAAIKARHPVEASAKDIADEADIMRSLFAGPGAAM